MLEQFSFAVIGLGYVGLPLADLFLTAGHTVYGVDSNAKKVRTLLKKRSYLSDLSDEDVGRMVNSGRFHPSTEYGIIAQTDAIIICVPTPLTDEGAPDLSFVVSAVTSAVPHLRPGQLIVLESSTYPGTTEELVPLIEGTGLTVGRDVYLAYSPERIDPGRRGISLCEIPKVVGGMTHDCLARATEIYGTVFRQVFPVSSARVAEMTKLLENTQRLINISFMNEFASLCDGLDINVWEVIRAASTKPYGFTEYYPGPGVGGHCIPIDPLYLLWKAQKLGHDLRFVELAKQINDEMPTKVVDKVKKALLDKGGAVGKHILVLGVAYKKNVNDVRHSSALYIIEHLLNSGACVQFYDPLISTIQVRGQALHRVDLSVKSIQAVDCVLILTDHDGVRYDWVEENAELVVDTRNVLSDLQAKPRQLQGRVER